MFLPPGTGIPGSGGFFAKHITFFFFDSRSWVLPAAGVYFMMSISDFVLAFRAQFLFCLSVRVDSGYLFSGHKLPPAVSNSRPQVFYFNSFVPALMANIFP